MARPDFKDICISQEYNTHVAWNPLAPIVATIASIFTDKRITIDNPDKLIAIMLSSWTKPVLAKYNDDDDLNSYKTLFIKYKDVDLDDINKYRKQFDKFKKYIKDLKSHLCKKISPRKPTKLEYNFITNNLNAKKFEEEVSDAISYYMAKEKKEFIALAKDVANFCRKEILEYIKNNIVD